MEIDSAIKPQIIGQFDLEQPSRKLALFGLVGLSLVFILSILFNPPAEQYFTVCGFKTLTGLPCPGCGLTHSFCALGKAKVADAFVFNLLGPPLFLSLVGLWIRSACVLMNRTAAVQQIDRSGERLQLVRAFIVAFAVYGVARIVYLLCFNPAAYHASPLSRLLLALTQ
jgi:hypothetical protein